MDQDPNQRPQEEPRNIPTPDVPGVPPPPPPQQRSSTRRWVYIGLGGCGALVLLVLLVVGGCAAILGSVGTSNPGSESKDEDVSPGAEGKEGKQKKSKSSGKEQPAVVIGEPVTVGDVTWTVTNAYPTERLESNFGQFGDSKQGNFVVVDFDFVNNSNEALTLATQSVALIDSEGRESQADSDSFEYIPRDRNIFLEQVNPGVTEQGSIIFTVAPGASGFTLQVGDAKLFSDQNGSVNLGF